MSDADLIRFYGFIILANIWLMGSSQSQFWRQVTGIFYLAVAIYFLLFPPPAHAESDADNDGFATVLTAPINEAIDAAFSIIGYEENDDD